MKHTLYLLLILVLFPLFLTAQETSLGNVEKMTTDTVWLNQKQETCNKDTATYKRVLTLNKGLDYTVKDFKVGGELFMSGKFSSLNPDIKEGSFYWYYPNGKNKRMVFFEKNIKVYSQSWDSDGNLIKPHLDKMETMPQFPKGDKGLLDFITNNLRYPEQAKYNRIQGRVIVRFIVTSTGGIRDVKVLKGVNASLDNEAVRVIKILPKWQPGLSNGMPVDVYYTIPISFKMQGKEQLPLTDQGFINGF